MKKVFIYFVLLQMACGNSYVQAQIHDPARVYDTVTDADSFYLFPPFKPCFNPGRYDWAPLWVMLQEYVCDKVTVYGVAITVENRFDPLDDNNANYNTRYGALLMNRLGPSPLSNYAYEMELVDSVSLNRAQPRFCWFLYEDSCDNTNSLVTSCYEFYFDTYEQYNWVRDTFYVGRFYEGLPGDNFSPEEYGGEYSASLPTNIYYSSGYTGNALNAFIHCDGYQDRKWGVAFPIIGFRCGPIKQYWLDAYTGDSAVVRWRSVEEGTLYNVRLTGSDGCDTTVVTADTTIVLTPLSDSVRYNVMLRKQCHYATQNYDTTVYGQWLSHISFGTSYSDTIGGSDTTGHGDTTSINSPDAGTISLTPNPASNFVAVVSEAEILTVEVYDAGGQQMLSLKVDAFEATLDVRRWPAGTYLLRVTTPAGTVTKRLLVR